MKVALDTVVLEDAELRAITKHLSGGKHRRPATRKEAKAFLEMVLSESITALLVTPPAAEDQQVPEVASGGTGPGPDAELAWPSED